MLNDIKIRTVIKAALVTAGLFLLQISLSYVFIRSSSLYDMQKNLITFADRIDKDLSYVNGKWNTNKYDADPQTPHPNGSSGFSKPLYVITTEGYIMERSKPIAGLLDVSDYKYMIQFTSPQTITTVANEKWRVLSKPIIKDGRSVGVVLTALYDPDERMVNVIDQRLQDTIQEIQNSLIINDGKIDTSKLDIRNIHYEYSFEIVDSYNNVLINNGRTPSFIDVSYIKDWLEHPKKVQIKDAKTGATYFVVSKNIVHNGTPVGLIITAESLTPLETLLKKLFIFSIISAILLVFPFGFFLYKTVTQLFGSIISSQAQEYRDISTLKSIKFNKKTSILTLNDEEYTIPYASNQYYLCEAICLSTRRRWEVDELLEKMGENIDDKSNARKVYDAMLALHKKVRFKIIEYKDKTYFLNPLLYPVTQK